MAKKLSSLKRSRKQASTPISPDAHRLKHNNKWRTLSESIRSKWLQCQHPQFCEQQATSVHHIMGSSTHPNLFYKETNLIPLCRIHHDQEDHKSYKDQLYLANYWSKRINDSFNAQYPTTKD